MSNGFFNQAFRFKFYHIPIQMDFIYFQFQFRFFVIFPLNNKTSTFQLLRSRSFIFFRSLIFFLSCEKKTIYEYGIRITVIIYDIKNNRLIAFRSFRWVCCVWSMYIDISQYHSVCVQVHAFLLFKAALQQNDL